MKRLLLATAAVIALAVAAPIATAQYTTPPPATAPYTTPVPDDPSTPQDESAANQPDTTTNQPTSPGTPESADDPTAMTTTTPSPDLAQDRTTTPDRTLQAQTTDPTTPDAATPDSMDTMQAQTDPSMTSTPGAQTTYADATTGMGENVATPASLEEHARDAGMDGLPMSPQEVCAPREISLTTSGTRLSRDKQHQLINAADRASVCEFQRVVINSPNGRADSARQLLIDHGIDAGLIEVVDGDAAGLEVEMQFAGLATSSEQYAQMFNPTQMASYQPSPMAAPSYSTAPSPMQPSTPPPDTSVQPMPSTPPASSDPSMQTPEPNADPMDDTEEDGMSPTGGEPSVTPDMLDI